MKILDDICFAKIFSVSNRLPFRIRAAGHVIVNDGYKEKVRLCNFVELFWCIKGSCQFIYPDGVYTLKAGDVCFYPCGTVHDYTPDPGEFEYCWMSIEGEQIDEFFKGFHASPYPRHVGPCPEDRFLMLIKELRKETPETVYSQLSQGLRILIAALTPSTDDAMHPHMDYAKTARQLADEHFTNSETTVQFLADRLHVHRGYLSRIFHQKYQVTLADYILQLRYEHAQELLVTTDTAAGEISLLCGFADYAYFMRFFRKRSGMSPGQFRKKFTQK